MKTKYFSNGILAFLFISSLLSCKKAEVTHAPANLVGNWSTNIWYGVSGDICTFSVSSNANTGVITQLGSQPFNFSVGDILFSNITNVAPGSYTALGKYTFGTNNLVVGSTAASLTLQSNNTQLLVQYSEDPVTHYTPRTYIFVRQ